MRRLVAAVATVIVVVAGVWVTGAVLTEDADIAMVLTGLWFGVAGFAAILLARHRRFLAVPVVGAWLVTSAAVGGYLFWTSTVDDIVDENVVRAQSSRALPMTGAASAEPTEAAAPMLAAEGRFRADAHPTKGVAALIDTANGDRVLTLTRFRTDPGPDLRVYLVPGDGSNVKDAVDLGGLKGNKGDQQYDVPPDAPDGAVVIWCRAFTVAFGTAVLG